jgi:uncharacterized protein involved in exopolysaccharide biosynthesis
MHATVESGDQADTQFAKEKVSARELMILVWRHRWLLASLALIGAAAAGIAAQFVSKKYQAVTVLSPVASQSSTSALGSLGSAVSSQLGNIASIAGLSFSSSAGARAEAIATLQSDELTVRYIEENNLLPVLFSRQWDASRGQWKTTDPDRIPTPWKADQYFGTSVRQVTENNKTGLVTLTITWRDPRLAAQWANGLVKLTNSFLRDRAIAESQRNIAYLKEQAAATDVVEVRQSIYSLMESEIKTEMIARGREQYALKVIDPAMQPERAVYPKPSLWIAGGFAGGVLLALVAIAVRSLMAVDEIARRRQAD